MQLIAKLLFSDLGFWIVRVVRKPEQCGKIFLNVVKTLRYFYVPLYPGKICFYYIRLVCSDILHLRKAIGLEGVSIIMESQSTHKEHRNQGNCQKHNCNFFPYRHNNPKPNTINRTDVCTAIAEFTPSI